MHEIGLYDGAGFRGCAVRMGNGMDAMVEPWHDGNGGFLREGGVVIGEAAGLRKAAAPVLTLRATQTLRHAMA